MPIAPPCDLDDAASVYEATDDFTEDAIGLLWTVAVDDLPPHLLDAVRAWYIGTDEYLAAVRSVARGDR